MEILDKLKEIEEQGEAPTPFQIQWMISVIKLQEYDLKGFKKELAATNREISKYKKKLARIYNEVR